MNEEEYRRRKRTYLILLIVFLGMFFAAPLMWAWSIGKWAADYHSGFLLHLFSYVMYLGSVVGFIVTLVKMQKERNSTGYTNPRMKQEEYLSELARLDALRREGLISDFDYQYEVSELQNKRK